MKSICNSCGYIIDRDKIIKGKIVEEYKNMYGTRCPKCGTFNKPSLSEIGLTEKQVKMALLREQVLDKLRKKLRR